MYSYPVMLTRDGDTILATFPDVPSAVTFGDDEAEALARAADALESAFIAIIADKGAIPAPSKSRGPRVGLPPLVCAKVTLYEVMRAQGIGKAELARRLGAHLPQIDRMLDLRHASRLDQLDRALRALGKTLVIDVRDAA